MTPHDQARLGRLINDFIERSGIAPPLYLIAIGSNGAVIVTRHTDAGNEQVCASPDAGLASPVIVTIVGPNGGVASARIEIEPPTVQ